MIDAPMTAFYYGLTSDPKVKAIAYDELNGTFIALKTEKDVKDYTDAEYMIALYNAEEGTYQYYNYETDRFEDIK